MSENCCLLVFCAGVSIRFISYFISAVVAAAVAVAIEVVETRTAVDLAGMFVETPAEFIVFIVAVADVAVDVASVVVGNLDTVGVADVVFASPAADFVVAAVDFASVCVETPAEVIAVAVADVAGVVVGNLDTVGVAFVVAVVYAPAADHVIEVTEIEINLYSTCYLWSKSD